VLQWNTEILCQNNNNNNNRVTEVLEGI